MKKKRYFGRGEKIFRRFVFAFVKLYVSLSPQNKVRGVAQLVSAPRSGRGGRTFESSHPDRQSQ